MFADLVKINNYYVLCFKKYSLTKTVHIMHIFKKFCNICECFIIRAFNSYKLKRHSDKK